jgi:hypothetical protein
MRRWGDDEAEAAAENGSPGGEAGAPTNEALPEGEVALEKRRAWPGVEGDQG